MRKFASFIQELKIFYHAKKLYQRVLYILLVVVGGILLLAFLAIAGFAMSTPPTWINVRFSTVDEENIEHFREIILVTSTLFLLALSGVLWKRRPKVKSE